MKAQSTLFQQNTPIFEWKTIRISFLICLMLVSVAMNQIQAQNTSTEDGITVKGMVSSDEEGPLGNVNIALEGSKIGVTTDSDGTFIFPKALQPGDVLVFSYLGYTTERVKIKADTSFIDLKMTSEYIDIVGALSVNTPYKSKRSQ